MAAGSSLIAALRGASPSNEAQVQQTQTGAPQAMTFPWQRNLPAMTPMNFAAMPTPQASGSPTISALRDARMANAAAGQQQIIDSRTPQYGGDEYYDRSLDMWVTPEVQYDPNWVPPANQSPSYWNSFKSEPGDYDNSTYYDRDADQWLPTPGYEQPAYEAPAYQPPAVEQPTYEDLMTQFAAYEETPQYDDNSYYDPYLDMWTPAIQQPTYQEPAIQQPTYEDLMAQFAAYEEMPQYDDSSYYDPYLDMWVQRQ